MTYSQAEDQGRRSVGLTDRVKTNGQIDGWRRLRYLTREWVGNVERTIAVMAGLS